MLYTFCFDVVAVNPTFSGHRENREFLEFQAFGGRKFVSWLFDGVEELFMRLRKHLD
jgi:hypothetical protein